MFSNDAFRAPVFLSRFLAVLIHSFVSSGGLIDPMRPLRGGDAELFSVMDFSSATSRSAASACALSSGVSKILLARDFAADFAVSLATCASGDFSAASAASTASIANNSAASVALAISGELLALPVLVIRSTPVPVEPIRPTKAPLRMEPIRWFVTPPMLLIDPRRLLLNPPVEPIRRPTLVAGGDGGARVVLAVGFGAAARAIRFVLPVAPRLVPILPVVAIDLAVPIRLLVVFGVLGLWGTSPTGRIEPSRLLLGAAGAFPPPNQSPRPI
mmetsp:Transcript_41112/g.64222  ORF Transcript_41112/g.64222 Transcript_41112/m.64222 type:complete len:272 (-) Transcript_41112:161-976(-)